jgi:hypothetical protein
VSVEICGVVPLSVIELGIRVHVGGSMAAAGVIEQVKLTVPEDPLMPTTLSAVMLPLVAPGRMEMDPGWKPLGSPKEGATVTATEVEPVAPL